MSRMLSLAVPALLAAVFALAHAPTSQAQGLGGFGGPMGGVGALRPGAMNSMQRSPSGFYRPRSFAIPYPRYRPAMPSYKTVPRPYSPSMSGRLLPPQRYGWGYYPQYGGAGYPYRRGLWQ